jgi:hypothetical protein
VTRVLVGGRKPSLLTSLDEQAFRYQGRTPSSVTVGGHPKDVYMLPSDFHFTNVNLLGGDFCDAHGVYLAYDYVNSRVKLLFGGEWETARKPKL